MYSQTPAARVSLLVVSLLLLRIHSCFVFLRGGKIIEGEEVARWPLDLFGNFGGLSLSHHYLFLGSSHFGVHHQSN
jgi:hypothetical protein